MNNTRLLVLGVLLILTGFLGFWLTQVQDEPGIHPSVHLPAQMNPADLQRAIEQDVMVIDIRRPEEWRETGVIEGSYLLTAFDQQGRLTRDFPALFAATVDPEQPIVLICRTGNRTGSLSRILTEQAGYPNVHHVSDGIVSWIAAGGDVKACVERGPNLQC